MGVYVNMTQNGPLGASFREKCDGLLAAGAKEVERPDPKGWVPDLVCVVDNIFFGAAAHLYSPVEMMVFMIDRADSRPKRWFVWSGVEEYAK
jgi:hypothetical protein